MVGKYLQFTSENESGCLEWTRCLNTDGYPRAVINGNSNGKVHREVFFITNGFYPEVVRHSCDNPKCINPNHLVSGTSLDNVKDREERGRTSGYISKDVQNTIVSLRQSGLSYKEISAQTDVGLRKIEYVLIKSRKVG